jgi:hypothetical protein
MSEFQWNNFIAIYSHKQNDNIEMYPNYHFIYINETGRFQIDDKSFWILNGDPNFKYREGRQTVDMTRHYLYKKDGVYGIWDFIKHEFVPYPDQKRFSKLLYLLLKERYLK